MSAYTMAKLENERNEALAELAEVRARAERLVSMLDLETAKRLADHEVARKVIAERAVALAERDAALARAADSDARLVRAIDAAKAAALAALTAPSPAGRMVDGVRVETRGFEQLNPDFDAAEGGSSPELSDEERGRNTCGDADCPLCEYYR